MIRLFVVAPSAALRAGLRALLNPGEQFVFLGEAASFDVLEGSLADVDVVIHAAPVESGAAWRESVQAAFAERNNPPALLLLSDDSQAARQAAGLNLRAWGAVPVDVSAEELKAAVQALNEGLLVGEPHLMHPLFRSTREILSSLDGENPEEEQPVEALTAREAEVLQLLARGLPNKQIAAALKISEHTVKFHITSIYSKLGAANRTEAVRIGSRRGLILY